MKRTLLSIGEVSRMKGVSPKSLRYYERLGILTPAHVDPHSGYRYYAMNQMIVVDVIITCIELGIPLKTLTDYVGETGALDIASLLAKGRTKALENLRRARLSLAQIDGYLEEAGEQERLKNDAEPYLRAIAKRCILYTPWTGSSFDAKRYLSLTTELYERAESAGVMPLYQWGMAREPREAGARWCVFVEAAIEDEAFAERIAREGGREGIRPIEGADIFIASIPDGAYRGRRIRKAGFEACFRAVFDAADRIAGAIIATEVWDAEVNPADYVVELLERQ